MKGEILYNPELSVKENAKANGVSEANIRYYIKKSGTATPKKSGLVQSNFYRIN